MPTSVRIRRRLAWPDTDAAGVWHHTTLWRWLEEAEAELHRELGITAYTFGHTPRRHVEAEFLAPLRFDDEVDIDLAPVAFGRTSVTYEGSVEHGGQLVCRARMTAVLVEDGRARPWPEWAAPLREAAT